MRLDLLTTLNAERAARRAAVLVTDIASGAQRLVPAAQIASDPLAPALSEALATRRSRSVAGPDGGQVFLTVSVPPPRILIIGAVHIAQALAPMAIGCGHDVTIIDPRTAFATAERFPASALVHAWPDAALARLGLDLQTAVVALSHDPKIDDPGLIAALKSDCYYVGALGSRASHARRIERLRAAGVEAAAIGRIHGPVGLDIGAESPAEIALSILAEITAALHPGKRRAS